jgi:hypothetical protein
VIICFKGTYFSGINNLTTSPVRFLGGTPTDSSCYFLSLNLRTAPQTSLNLRTSPGYSPEIGVPFWNIKSSDSRLGKMSVQQRNVAVAFRPEDVEVVIDGPVQQSINVFEATVISTAYMGSLLDLQCDVVKDRSLG